MSADSLRQDLRSAPQWARRALLAALPALMAGGPASAAPSRPQPAALSGKGQERGDLRLPEGEAPCPMVLDMRPYDAGQARGAALADGLAAAGLGVLRLAAPANGDAPSPESLGAALDWLSEHPRASAIGVLGAAAQPQAARLAAGDTAAFILLANDAKPAALTSVPEELVAAMAAVLAGDELNARLHTLIAVVQPMMGGKAREQRAASAPTLVFDPSAPVGEIAAWIAGAVSSPA